MKSALLLCVVALVASVAGHSWLDCINVTNPLDVTNLGNLRCNGFPRGYVGRTVPDDNMWKMEGMSPTSQTFYNFPACRWNTRKYTTQYPMLRLKAGEKMTIAYTPNGHTRWHSPPPPNGPRDFWVKWSGVANRDLTTMQEVLNAPSLLQVIFDAPCHSRRDGRELDSSSGICQADVTIPANTPAGTYQLVWWWPFRFSNTVVEDYTSCWDVEVIASTNTGSATSTSTSTSTTARVSTSTSTSTSSTSTTAKATSTSTSGSTSTSTSTSGGSSGGSIPVRMDTVILSRTPVTIPQSGIFNVSIAYVARGQRDIIVDILDKTNFNWFGKGVASVLEGKGTTSLTVRVQNNPPQSANYMLHVWSVDKGMADVPNAWTSAYDEHNADVTVGSTLTYNQSC